MFEGMLGGIVNYFRDDRTRCMALIGLTLLFLFADQNLLAPNLTECAQDFGMSDEERDKKLGGQIALGFFLLGAPAAIGAGYMADVMNRYYPNPNPDPNPDPNRHE